MSRIKSKNTRIEVDLRKALWLDGLRFRKNFKKLPGRPDIAITKYKIAIFCDGEFWHGKDWELKKLRIKSNREYWIKKIEQNIERDRETDRQLNGMGWTVLRFWGNDIKKNIVNCVDVIKEAVYKIIIDSYDEFSYEDN
jgi:DNA mismatch endonuclease (patch repair protein)